MTGAASAGDPARVRLLLERGVPPEPLGGEVLARRAERARRVRSTVTRLPVGPRPSIERPASFEIPLFCAAESGSADCVDLLLEAGASPAARDDQGRTALFHAGSDAAVARLARAGTDVRACDEAGQDALEHVLGEFGPQEGRWLEVARALVAAGAPLERIAGSDTTRLWRAAFGHRPEAVEFLLDLGLGPDVPSAEGQTPLHAVCWHHDYDAERNVACERVVRALVGAGSQVDRRDAGGRTPLLHAVSGDGASPTAVGAMLAAGADPDLATPQGTTPLMCCAERPACVSLLLAAGADPRRTDANGLTALEHAQAHLRAFDRLGEEGTPEHRARFRRSAAAVRESVRRLEAARGAPRG